MSSFHVYKCNAEHASAGRKDSDLHLNSIMEKSFQNCMELLT